MSDAPTSDTESYLKFIFEVEEERHRDLTNLGKLFSGVISGFLGLVAFRMTDFQALFAATHDALLYAHAIGLLALAVALLLVVRSMGIRVYERLNDPEAVLESCERHGWDGAKLRMHRMADYAIAANRNKLSNDAQAYWLRISGWFMLFGLIMLIGSATIASATVDIWSA